MAILLGSPTKCDECGTTLADMVSSYNKIPTEDLTCYITELDRKKALVQLASGGGECRLMKNALRTAMCSLIMGFLVDSIYYGRRVDGEQVRLKGVIFHFG